MDNTLQLIIKLRDEASTQLKTFAGKLDDVGGKLKGTGADMIALGAAPTAALALATKTAIDFESSFAGIRKTVDASEAEFAALTTNIRNIAKEAPISTTELNKIGEMAGQLGVRGVDNLTSFIETVSKIGVTTNLTTEEAATSFARIANIMQEPIENVDRMASVVVDLGNNFATTEREITEFANRIAGAGSIAGLATNEIFSIGAAMSSVGVEAEAGGTAVQKVLISMNTAVVQGNEDLAVFAKTAGLTLEEFKDLSAIERFQNFVMGLGDAGDDAINILEQLGMTDQRLMRAFLSLANAGDLVINATEKGTTAWKENTALTIEAEKRYATTESQLKILRNTINDIGITLGSVLLPAINKLVASAKPMIDTFANFAKENPVLLTALLAVGAGIGALGVVLLALGVIASGVGAVMTGMAVVLAVVTSPIFLIVAAIVAVIAVLYIFREQIMTVFNAVYTTITTVLSSVYTSIVTIFTGIYNSIITVLTAIWNFISPVVNNILAIFQFVFMGIWFVIQVVFALIHSFITGTLNAIWGFMSPTLNNWKNKFTEAFNAIKSTVISIFSSVQSWFTTQLNAVTQKVTDAKAKIVEAFKSMASGIMSALKTIKFPHLSIGSGEVEVAGRKIQYPKLNVSWYEKGGYVPNTGLAMLHAGEFVMSKDMLSGKKAMPNYVTENFNQPINITNIVNGQADLDSLGYQLAWAMRNSR